MDGGGELLKTLKGHGEYLSTGSLNRRSNVVECLANLMRRHSFETLFQSFSGDFSYFVLDSTVERFASRIRSEREKGRDSTEKKTSASAKDPIG